MQRITTSKEIAKISQVHRNNGLQIGFVPTMGALHKGHLSLVERSKNENDITICSIFVNPTQFNDAADFQRYPRTLERDSQLLEGVNCDYLFAPTSKEEIYPVPDKTEYELGSVAAVLEGKHRPGHFNGVASVVKRFFEIVKPHKAYFGLKDYQQYLVIKQLVENYNLDVDVIGCPIVRSEKGLAMSSRNTLLLEKQTDHALTLFNSLKKAKSLLKSGKSPNSIEKEIVSGLQSDKVDLEYFEIRNAADLSKPKNPNEDLVALVAARFGEIRLIDNMNISSN